MAYCKQEGYGEETYNAQYPHPYIIIWTECLRQANPITGQPSYPDPMKGYLDQDADLMIGYNICEEWRAEKNEQKKKMEEHQAYVADFFRGRQ